MVVARDFFLTPEELASVHLADKVHWPTQIAIGEFILGIGLLAARASTPGWRRAAARARPRRRTTRQAPPGGRVRQAARARVTVLGRYGLQAAVACAIGFAFFLSQYLVPTLSTHFSFKPVLESYAKFAKHGEKIGRYRVEGHGSGFYGKDNLVDLPNQDRLVDVPARSAARLRAGRRRRAGGARLGVQAGAGPLLRHRRVVVALPAAHQPARAGRARSEPATKDVWMPPAGVADAKPPWTWRIPL